MPIFIEKTKRFSVYSYKTVKKYEEEEESGLVSSSGVNAKTKHLSLPPKPWDYAASYKVAKTGDVECMRFMKEGGLQWDRSTCMQAAQNGHLELLKYLQSASCPWDYRTTRAAAERGDLTMLAWLRQEHTTGTTGRCPWNSDTALGCCSKGQMDALIWMRHHSDAGDPVPYDTGCCAAAALIGRLDLLQYLREDGCSWDKNTCYSAVEGSQQPLLQKKHLEILQWALENGCPWSKRECLDACAEGSIRDFVISSPN